LLAPAVVMAVALSSSLRLLPLLPAAAPAMK
jgi:hypothetical protein